MEVNAEVKRIDNVTSSWQSVSFAQSYTDPIVVARPEYDLQGTDKTFVIEIKDVTATGCQIRHFFPPSTGASNEPTNTIAHLMVVENTGTATDAVLAGTSIKVQASKFDTTNIDGKNNGGYNLNVASQTVYPSFASDPMVFGTRVTHNDDTRWAETWCAGANSSALPSASNLYISFHDLEAGQGDFSSAETLHYVMLDRMDVTHDLLGKMQGQVTTDSVQGLGSEYTASISGFSQTPEAVLVSQPKMDGGDGGWGHLLTRSSGSVDIVSLEDQAGDSERTHTSERMYVFAVENEGTFNQASEYPNAGLSGPLPIFRPVVS